MTYQDFITKNNLWRAYLEYRSKHLSISKQRAMRAFCCSHGFILNRRQKDAKLDQMIKIAKVNLYEMH